MERDVIAKRGAREVLGVTLWVYPDKLTPQELVHELTSDPASSSEENAVQRVVDKLIGHGLIERDGDVLLPSEAARTFHWVASYPYFRVYVSPETRKAARAREVLRVKEIAKLIDARDKEAQE